MKRLVAPVLLLLASAAPAAELSDRMSGVYRCDGGVSFQARVKVAPVPRAHVAYDGRNYIMPRQSGAGIEFESDDQSLHWTIDEDKPPFSGTLYHRNDKLGEHCRLVQPESKK